MVHIPRGDDSQQIIPSGEYYYEQSVRIGFSKNGPSLFSLGMLRIIENDNGLVEKHLLALPILDVMLDEILIVVASIPLKAFGIKQDIHAP